MGAAYSFLRNKNILLLDWRVGIYFLAGKSRRMGGGEIGSRAGHILFREFLSARFGPKCEMRPQMKGKTVI